VAPRCEQATDEDLRRGQERHDLRRLELGTGERADEEPQRHPEKRIEGGHDEQQRQRSGDREPRPGQRWHRDDSVCSGPCAQCSGAVVGQEGAIPHQNELLVVKTGYLMSRTRLDPSPAEAAAHRARRSTCAVACALDVVGDRCTLLVICDLLGGKTRYSDFLASEEKIPTNILADRLKRLEREGLIERVPYSEHPPRFEYHLTAEGCELGRAVDALATWGLGHFPGSVRTIPSIDGLNTAQRQTSRDH
jgi:DNA-binding HxlR family transcriptional regulator